MSDNLRRDFDTVGQDEIDAESTDDTAEIREGIEQTRSEMSETIEAIQARLNPEHLKDQVKEQVREQFQEVKATVRDATIGKAEEMARNVGESVTDARYTVMETISHNPIPAVMVALGLGWLWMNRRNAPVRRAAQYGEPSRYRVNQPYYAGQSAYEGARPYDDRPVYGTQYSTQSQGYERGVVDQGRHAVGSAINRVQETAGDVASKAQATVGDTVQRVQETAGDVASKAQETASQLVDRSQEAVSNIADQAQYQAQRLEDRFQETLRTNPLVVGAVAVALGTAVGLAIPETRREHELMGEARDNLVGKVQTAVQETVEKVQQVAGDVMDDAKTTAQESAKEQGLTAR